MKKPCDNCLTPHVCKRFDQCDWEFMKELERDLPERYRKYSNSGAETPFTYDEELLKQMNRTDRHAPGSLYSLLMWFFRLVILALAVACITYIAL